jgi:hypothetical protein
LFVKTEIYGLDHDNAIGQMSIDWVGHYDAFGVEQNKAILLDFRQKKRPAKQAYLVNLV